MPNETEPDLIAAAKAGDAGAFERLIAPHLPMLVAYCRAICGDHHVAEDAAQETALVAFRNLQHLFADVEFSIWLRAIARRQALSARRASNRLGTVTEQVLEGVYADSKPEALSPERDALSECLKVLTGRTAEVVRGHYFEGSPLTSLAERLSLNLNTLKTMLFRARATLQDCMERRLRTGVPR
jgi:RNA polymerase sigma-70 factor, ECF subfamily